MAASVIQENGCPRAKRMDHSIHRFRTKPINIATIDFGTTHCSVTYQLNVDKLANGGEKPEILTLDDKGDRNVRVPSCILFDQSGHRVAFGYQAREQYYAMDHVLRPEFIYFEHVKMKLHHEKSVDRTQTVEALNGCSYFLVDVIANILCYLKEQLLCMIHDFGLESYESTDFDWVVTVPAIWKAKGKRMMREAGYEAGLCSIKTPPFLKPAIGFSPLPVQEKHPEKLSLAIEPESAAIYCQRLAANVKSIAGERFRHNSEHYLVLDIGGGTADIATHSVVGNGIVELAPSAGNDWGGTRVNQQYEKFLADFVQDPGFSRYLNDSLDIETSARRKAELTSLIYTDFEIQKLSFGRGISKQSFKIEFPRTFWQVYGDDIVQEGRNFSRRGEKGILIEDDGCVMRILPEKMIEFFQPAVDNINTMIESHLQMYNLTDFIDTVYLVGGFGGCNYLRKKIEEKLKDVAPNCSICVPPEPNLAVIFGATAYRCNPSIVTKRKADASYGLSCIIPFDSSIHRLDYRYWNEDKQAYCCDNLFASFVERGEHICTNEVFVMTYSPDKKAQTSMNLRMYSAPRKGVWYTTEDEVYELGKVDIQMGGYGLGRSVEVVLDITHTELQLLARDKTSGGECKLVVDFLSSERD